MQAENLRVELAPSPERGGEPVTVYVRELTLAEIRAYFRGEELNRADPPPLDDVARDDLLWDNLLTVDDVVTVADLLRMSTATREQLYGFTPAELSRLVAKVKAANPVFFRVDALMQGQRSTMGTAPYASAPVSSAPSAH